MGGFQGLDSAYLGGDPVSGFTCRHAALHKVNNEMIKLEGLEESLLDTL